MKVFLNGRLVEERAAKVSVFDHGFLYGDGVYETVRVVDGQLFLWPEHFRRLRESARRIELALPWGQRTLATAIRRTLRANRLADGSARLTVSRGPGPLGLNPRLCRRPTLTILVHPPRPIDDWRRRGMTIALVRVRRNAPQALDPRIKSNNSLNTILARLEANRWKTDEGILLNLDGYLAEGTISNLFWIQGRSLFTPALSCGLLEGVTRDLVLRLASKAGLVKREGRFKPAALRRADEIFLTNASWDVMPVTRVIDAAGSRVQRFAVGDGRPGPRSVALQAAVEAERRRLI